MQTAHDEVGAAIYNRAFLSYLLHVQVSFFFSIDGFLVLEVLFSDTIGGTKFPRFLLPQANADVMS